MITMKIRDTFFDRQAVLGPAERARKKSLSKAGAFVSTTARRSIKRRKKPSWPGQPPHAHSSSEPNLKTILFGWDRANDGVVIGPIELRSRETDRTAPDLHEHGGSTAIRRKVRRYVNGTKVTLVKNDRAYFPRRPFMGPALDREIAAGTIPNQFKNSIVGP